MSAMMFDNALVTSMMEEAIAFCAEKTGAGTREGFLMPSSRATALRATT